MLWLLWTSVDPALSSSFGTSSGAAVVPADAVVESVLTLADAVEAVMDGGVAAEGVVGLGLH